MKKYISFFVTLAGIFSRLKVDAFGNRVPKFPRDSSICIKKTRNFKLIKNKKNNNSGIRKQKIVNDISRAKKVVEKNPGGEWKVRKVNGKKIVYYSVGGVTIISVPFIVYLVIKLATKSNVDASLPNKIDISASDKWEKKYDEISKEYFSLINEAKVMDFLKDYKSMVTFINDELPKVTEILKKQPALTTLDAKADVMIIGDVHGTTEVLQKLIPKIWNFLKENDQNSIVILGDFIDRRLKGRDDSIYATLWFFNLIKLYPDRVRILRGNHENSRYGHQGSLKDWWCGTLEDCMSELPIACVISHNGKKYFAVHGGIDSRLEIKGSTNNLIKRHVLGNKDLSKNKKIMNYLESRLIWNDFRKNDEDKIGRKHFCNAEEVAKFFEKFGYSAIIRAHDPIIDPVLKFGDKKVITVHSYSLDGEKACQKLNARVAYIRNDGIELDYFFDDKTVGVNEDIDWNNF